MKRKFIHADFMDFIHAKFCNIYTVESPFRGYVSFIRVDECIYDIPVDYDDSGTPLLGKGYTVVLYLPFQKNWCLSTVLDENEDIVEWYFDIIHGSGTENSIPYFDDLYLDIVIPPNGVPVTLDKDELMNALDEGVITKSDYILALKTAEEIYSKHVKDEELLVNFTRQQIQLNSTF